MNSPIKHYLFAGVLLICIGVFWNCSSNPPEAGKTLSADKRGEASSMPEGASRTSGASSGPVDSLSDGARQSSGIQNDSALGKPGQISKIVKKKVIKKRRIKKKYNPAALVCEANPGTMKGSGVRGEYQLDGSVTCLYEKLTFNTQKAIWNRKKNTVKFYGGMKVETNGLILTSEQGGYKKEESIIWAKRNAKVRDTSGTYHFSSDYLSYHLEDRLLTLKNRAHLQQTLKDTLFKKPNLPKSGIKKINQDTLHIYANSIVYNDSLKWAKANKKVKVVKGKLRITCEHAYYSEKSETIDFLENPRATFKHNLMRGDTMKLQLRGQTFESMSFKSSAKGDFYENEDSTRATEEYHVMGDSILMKMDNDRLQYIDVFDHGVAEYILRKYPDQLNQMKGHFLKLNFKGDKIDSASIFGRAKSTYFIYDKDKFQGKNEAKGDSIALTFANGKVNNIYIKGAALGTFFGEPPKPEAKVDTLKQGVE